MRIVAESTDRTHLDWLDEFWQKFMDDYGYVWDGAP
jgi:hypothetical protein